VQLTLSQERSVVAEHGFFTASPRRQGVHAEHLSAVVFTKVPVGQVKQTASFALVHRLSVMERSVATHLLHGSQCWLVLLAQDAPAAQLVHLVLAVLVHAAVCTVPEPHTAQFWHSV
jgi:hypothetical protein